MQVRWAGDRCSVCDNDVDFDFDQLVSCDACGLTVHQSCYGVPDLPGATRAGPAKTLNPALRPAARLLRSAVAQSLTARGPLEA